MRFGDEFDSELILAAIALAFAVAIMASISCTTSRGLEPEWKPDVYLYSPIQSRCILQNADGHKIDCDEPQMHDLGCIPLDQFKALKFKIQRCEAWR